MSGTVIYWIVVIVLFIGLVYFLFIRPQQNRTKEHDKLMKEVKPGSHVITMAGIYGEVASVGEDTVILKLEGGATMKVSKASIAGLQQIEAE
jgi:preprotein translocase subunit YajC